jgi:LAO/AO transport system kinase
VLPSETTELIQRIRSGHRLTLARTISRVEEGGAAGHALLAALFPYSGQAHIVGVTGAPGTGKSTLAAALAQRYRAAGQSVGIVAVDPTSPFSGGALLGDRVRMRALSGDAGVFVRSMATRGSLGGLSKTTADVVTVLDAAGFDRILVETVGVGQAEVEVARTAHTTVVVEAPGFGDEVQALKAGILEIADLLVVNKADLPGVERTVQALEMALELAHSAPRPLHHHGQWLTLALPTPIGDPATRWPVRVHRTVAASGHGIDALHQRVEEHVAWLRTTGELVRRERGRILHTLENMLRAAWEERIQRQLAAAGLERLVEAIQQRKIDPYTAAKELLARDKELRFML